MRSVTDSEDNFILIQAGQERGEDWELVEHREISGLVIDISEENYRGSMPQRSVNTMAIVRTVTM